MEVGPVCGIRHEDKKLHTNMPLCLDPAECYTQNRKPKPPTTKPYTAYRIPSSPLHPKTKIMNRSTLIILIAGVLLASCQTEESTTNEAPRIPGIPVRVESISVLESMEPILAVGQVVSGEDLYLGFRTGGVIKRVYVSEGQQVKAGQLLAELDLAEVSAQVNQATVALEKAERDLARVTRLYEDTVATLEQVQDLTSNRDVAYAQLQLAQSQQRHAKLLAPTSGRILKKMAQTGEIAGPGSPVLQIGTAGDTRVLKVGMADVDIVQVSLGDEAIVTFDAWPGVNFPARVTELSPSADPRTGSYTVELTFQAQPKPLRNGFVGKAVIERSSEVPMAKIPLQSIARADGDSVWVFVPDSDSTVRELKVGPILLGDEYVAVPLPQLQDHDIVTDGASYLQEGMLVRIVPSQAAGTTYLGQR